MYYIPIRYTVAEIGAHFDELREKGFSNRVEYDFGGWSDYETRLVVPHVRFVNEDDAIAYKLAFGGEILREKPLVNQIVSAEL
jgi:hypothetical protein